jgi:hypothetical protein
VKARETAERDTPARRATSADPIAFFGGFAISFL